MPVVVPAVELHSAAVSLVEQVPKPLPSSRKESLDSSPYKFNKLIFGLWQSVELQGR